MSQAAPVKESRIDPRFPASAVPTITSMRLSPGDTVELLDISRSGALVEGCTRFVPGTRITVLFEGGFSPARIKGKVIRCHVSSINNGTLRYQSGIQFENRLDSNPGEIAAAPPRLPDSAGGPSTGQTASAAAAAAPAPATRAVNRW